MRGFDLFGEALRRENVEKLFFIMGGPNIAAAAAAANAGVKMIDVRHEQAAAMMAHAYARTARRPGFCMGASGPGAINLTTGLANALIDCTPVIAFGGASTIGGLNTGSFQEIDQVAIMRPVTKWADRVYETKRIPEYINRAIAQAMSGKPGPVYLDLPGDVLNGEVNESDVKWPQPVADRWNSRIAAPADKIEQLADALMKAERPLIVSGSGVLWSSADSELRELAEMTAIPLYTTPQGRGVLPEDSKLFFGAARGTAMKEADFVLVVGTRLNFIIGHGRAPTFSEKVRLARIDIDPQEIVQSPNIANVEIGIVGDVKAVIGQLLAALRGRFKPTQISAWTERLAKAEADRKAKEEKEISTDQLPIHPLRLCKEVRDFIDRDAILVVDGQEILNYGRRVMPTFHLGHRLNSGPFGIMGVGLPFGVGAKAAKPDKQVVVVHGDGSFGLNAMELDTAVRHKLPLLVVISLNGGWTADPEKVKVGRDLGYTRFDKMAEALGCYAEYVENPADIAPALRRAQKAVNEGKVAVVNVVTDWAARSTMRKFTAYST